MMPASHWFSFEHRLRRRRRFPRHYDMARSDRLTGLRRVWYRPLEAALDWRAR